MKNFVLAGANISDSDLHALPSVASASLRTQDIVVDCAATFPPVGHDSNKPHGGADEILADGSTIYAAMTSAFEILHVQHTSVVRERSLIAKFTRQVWRLHKAAQSRGAPRHCRASAA